MKGRAVSLRINDVGGSTVRSQGSDLPAPVTRGIRLPVAHQFFSMRWDRRLLLRGSHPDS